MDPLILLSLAALLVAMLITLLPVATESSAPKSEQERWQQVQEQFERQVSESDSWRQQYLRRTLEQWRRDNEIPKGDEKFLRQWDQLWQQAPRP